MMDSLGIRGHECAVTVVSTHNCDACGESVRVLCVIIVAALEREGQAGRSQRDQDGGE